MIQFDFDWSEPVNLILLALLIVLLFVQLWLLVFRGRQVFTGRSAVRLGLNLLLWIAIAAFIFQPYFKKDSVSVHALIVGKDVPSDFAAKLKDSLKTAEGLDFPSFRQGRPAMENLRRSNIDTLFLAGQDFEPALFQALTQTEEPPIIKWIYYSAVDQLGNLKWKAILRKGEIQSIQGNIESLKKQVLKLRYGSQILDSTSLFIGHNKFKLSFPVFGQGRMSANLVLDNKTIDTIRFFARPNEPLTFHVIMDNPDFESRNLANWLGKNGHSVVYTTTLSKDIKSKLTINKAKDPDVIITGPDNVSNAQVKKQLANGKSVLFINLSNPVSEIAAVNAALGTKLQIRKISNETAITISPELTALPYQFVTSNHYLPVAKYPVAIEKMSGKIGVSLLNETFPLILNGDSVTYQKVWNSILASLHPATQSNVDMKAPIYQNLNTAVNINNFTSFPKFLKMGNDTLFLTYSPLNNRSANGCFTPTESGWNISPDSSGIEYFVENENDLNLDFNTEKMKDFVRTYTSLQAKLATATIGTDFVADKGIKKKFSDWAWFAIVIGCIVGAWVEGKL